MKISASLVLYQNDPEQYSLAIKSFLDGSDGFLYIIDNSPYPLRNNLFDHPRVKYLYPGKNLGFGKAHNLAIKMLPNDSEAHLLLNPDVIFSDHVIPTLCNYLKSKNEVGAVMPKIEYPDGGAQNLCKLLPTPTDLILRRFIPFKSIKEKLNKHYELHALPQDNPSTVPSLSGCFLLIKTDILRKTGGFDERYFMYMEDVDLVRRIGDLAQTVYFPSVKIIHSYAKGSYKNKKLLNYHLKSAIKYFFKWGWFFDSTRKVRNMEISKNLASNYGSKN